ncbi:hypothetical protein F5888DRAFT_1362223 [Russula emetica]|nr:hypothetical protein F5888DRAFT_1362223 [Russula emetica]
MGKGTLPASIKWRRRAPKGASCLVSLLRFLRYLNTLPVDPMRRSLTAVARTRSGKPLTTATCSPLHYIQTLNTIPIPFASVLVPFHRFCSATIRPSSFPAHAPDQINFTHFSHAAQP